MRFLPSRSLRLLASVLGVAFLLSSCASSSGSEQAALAAQTEGAQALLLGSKLSSAPAGPVLVSAVDAAGSLSLYIDAAGSHLYQVSGGADDGFAMLVVDGESFVRSPQVGDGLWVALGRRTVWSVTTSDEPASALLYDDVVASTHRFSYRECFDASGFPSRRSDVVWELSCPGDRLIVVELDEEFRLRRTSSQDRYHVNYAYPPAEGSSAAVSSPAACPVFCEEAAAAFGLLRPPGPAQRLTGELSAELFVRIHEDFLSQLASRAVSEMAGLFQTYYWDPTMSLSEIDAALSSALARSPLDELAKLSVDAAYPGLLTVRATGFGVWCETRVKLDRDAIVPRGDECGLVVSGFVPYQQP